MIFYMLQVMNASWSVYLTAKAEKEVDVDKYDEKFVIFQRSHGEVSLGRWFLYIAPWDKTIKPLASINMR